MVLKVVECSINTKILLGRKKIYFYMSTNCFQTIKIMDICVECQYFYGKFGNKCS